MKLIKKWNNQQHEWIYWWIHGLMNSKIQYWEDFSYLISQDDLVHWYLFFDKVLSKSCFKGPKFPEINWKTLLFTGNPRGWWMTPLFLNAYFWHPYQLGLIHFIVWTDCTITLPLIMGASGCCWSEGLIVPAPSRSPKFTVINHNFGVKERKSQEISDRNSHLKKV